MRFKYNTRTLLSCTNINLCFWFPLPLSPLPTTTIYSLNSIPLQNPTYLPPLSLPKTLPFLLFPLPFSASYLSPRLLSSFLLSFVEWTNRGWRIYDGEIYEESQTFRRGGGHGGRCPPALPRCPHPSSGPCRCRRRRRRRSGTGLLPRLPRTP